VKSQKCPYHVTFDLDLDLEHTVDTGSSVDHRVQLSLRSRVGAHLEHLFLAFENNVKFMRVFAGVL